MAKPSQQNKGITKAQLLAIGVSVADTFIKAQEQAETTQREVMLNAAKEHATNPEHVTTILEGFANELQKLGVSDSIIKVRKSEFKAVFDAVGKTEVSEFNTKQLQNFKGGYHAFVAKARELRGNKTRSSGQRERKAPEKLTDKQYESTEKNLEKASVSQLMDFTETAVSKVHQMAPAELAGYQSLLLIQTTATQVIKNDKVEEFFKKACEEVLAIVEPAIEQANKAMAKSKELAEKSQQQKGAVVTTEKEQTA